MKKYINPVGGVPGATLAGGPFPKLSKRNHGRITKKIYLDYPIFFKNNCKINISQMDACEWVKSIPQVDIIYLDPPYNKHPYSIYYFMLEIINNWDLSQNIPKT